MLLENAVRHCSMGNHLNRAFIRGFKYVGANLLGAMIEQLPVKTGDFIHIDGNGADIM